MHHIANGHNDILVGCLIASSFYLAIKEKYVWIIPLLAAATLMKYGPALLIPLAIVYVAKKKGWKTVALGCLLGVLLSALSSAPYLKDWEQLKIEDIRDNATLIDNSLHSFLIHIFGSFTLLFPALAQFHMLVNTVIKTALRGGLLLFFIAVLFKMLKNSSTSTLIRNSVLVMFVLICVASSKFNAWYLGMLLPPALFLKEEHWLRRLIVLITCAELLSLTFFKQAYMLNYFMILVPTWLIIKRVRRENARVAQQQAQSLSV